ncbi:protein OS-9 isoform X1 [Aphelocoma coerulescens]|uniref:protein OS-9 isoform X1 n=1 Tax=Aphelocoma coerulescens TaxID=39617 RepID=UPI003604A7F2
MAARRGPGPVAALALLALLGPGWPLRGARAALNLQELSELKYGLEILAEPVLAGQHQAEDVVTVASRFKQRYECRLPPAAVGPPPGPPRDPRLYNGSGVAELLRPMGTAPCLLKTKDWWTYEFCYGRHIQQYHLEESEIKGDILVLGYYQSAFDWDDEAAKASKQHQLRRYHSQSYVNGSRCDLTGRAREAEVRFLCEEGAGDYIARVDEPQSCSYVLTVHTTRICHHPFLRPSPGLAPQPIRCQPALSPAQYVQYVRAQVSDTKRKVEEISEELRSLDTRLWSDRDSESPSQSPEGTQDALSPPVPGNQPDPAKDVTGGEPVAASDQRDSTREPSPRAAGGRAADPRKKIHFKVIRSPGDLLQFIEELKETTRKAKEKASKEEEEAAAKAPPAPPSPAEPPSPEAPPGPEAPPAGAEEEEEEDEEEAGPLLAGLELLPREQVARLKEEVKSQMEQEFDSIISEVEDELETEGLKGEFDRTRATRTLASTLTRLMDRLDRAEPRHDPPEPRRDPPGPPPGPEGHREEEEEEEEEEGGAARKGSPRLPDGRVRVRMGRAGNRDAPQDPEPSQGKQEPPREDQEPPQEKQSPPQLPQVENEVRELLAKEGLRAEGKIEIKIVTASSGGEEEEAAQWLSEEDSRSLKEIFLSILVQGTEEAQKERRRQQALEDNYRFVWGGRDEPPPPADSEDQDF